MVVNRPTRTSQRGVTLVELVLSIAISAILLSAITSLIKLGLDAQADGRGRNELTYQARFALERIADKARAITPKELATPTVGTTGNWFAPAGCTGTACVMFCRNTSSQLIETTTTDASCTGTTIIASQVSAFAATLPADMGAVDRFTGVISLTMADSTHQSSTLSSSIRLGGGTQ